MATQRQIRVRPEVTREGSGYGLTVDVYDFELPNTYTLHKTMNTTVPDLESATIEALVVEILANERIILESEQAPANLTDDFATDVILLSYIAEWKGNSDGQLVDASGNGNTLVKVDDVFNPVTPTAPEGDMILARVCDSVAEGAAYGHLEIPDTARPKNAAGHVSFRLRFVRDANDDANVTFFGFDTGTGGGRRYLNILKSSLNNLVMTFTKSDGSNQNGILADASAFYDGSFHKMVCSWDAEHVRFYIDEVEVPDMHVASDIDFGVGPIESPENCGILVGLNTDLTAPNSIVIDMDDVIISTRTYVPAA